MILDLSELIVDHIVEELKNEINGIPNIVQILKSF